MTTNPPLSARELYDHLVPREFYDVEKNQMAWFYPKHDVLRLLAALQTEIKRLREVLHST